MSVVKVCQCCLSTDRRLAPMDKHAKLYQALLLTKTNIPVKKHRMVCWECLKILNNIQAFRSKVTQAQKLLNDKSLIQYVSLSTLSCVTMLDDCQMIIYDDIKNATLELESDFIKHEKHNEDEQYYALIDQSNVKDSDSSDQKEPFKEEMVKSEDDDNFDDTEITQESQDIEMLDDKNIIKEECDKPQTGANIIETKSEVIKKKITRNQGVLKKKYKTIIMENIADKFTLYDKIIIDQKRMEEWKEQLKNSRKKKKFQCEKCYYGFARQEVYKHHISVRHAARLGRLECDICRFRFAEKAKLLEHVAGHYKEFVCRLCAHTTRTRRDMYTHLAQGPHGRQMECKKCALRFDCTNRREFFDHYRSMHERFACDHCGRVYRKKLSIISHIKKNHTTHSCNLCNTRYNTLRAYKQHHQAKHVVEESDQNYCVECNIGFMNNRQYKSHLIRSTKHRIPRAFPCPECGKVYAKNCYMMNHYKLVHLKKSDHYCVPCDKYFLTGERVRKHQKYFHEKQPKPKNKICTYCGRGFHNKQELEKHVRTHTGERPFACALCAAAFTQKHCLTAHMRSAHK